jgi:hypothetical protein
LLLSLATAPYNLGHFATPGVGPTTPTPRPYPYGAVLQQA